MNHTIILLGRHGDIVNLLPLAKRLGGANWVVGCEFARLFDGVSYVNPIEFMRSPNHFDKALAFAKEKGYPNILPAQVFMNPDKRKLMPSFAVEAWRLAGYAEEWPHRLPLIFDKRKKEDEDKLFAKVTDGLDSRPIVLFAPRSMSSPFPKSLKLLAKLKELDANIVDMGYVSANRAYDMVGLFDRVACLVTIDTLHLHLARASYCPTVAILNDGWCGSIPPPQANWVHRYETGSVDIDPIVENVRDILKYREVSGITMAVDMWGDTDRHKRAQASWPSIPKRTVYLRNSLGIGDDRQLHYMKDVLTEAMRPSKGELVIWTNDDTSFTFLGLDIILQHAKKFPFGCVRRDSNHIGRECFWFRRVWLEQNIEKMPDVILGAPKCDLVIAQWLRKFYGIPNDLESMKYDYPPLDLPPGIIFHEPHPSAWLNHYTSASAIHNDNLWRI